MREVQGSKERRRRVTLDSAGVDLLELVRLGVLPLSALQHDLDGEEEVLLCDEEGTPLSALSVSAITHLRPLAEGIGPEWGPEVRQPVSAVLGSSSPSVALISYLPPSDIEIKTTATKVQEVGFSSLLLCALVSRTPVPDGAITASGLIRSLMAAANKLTAELHQQKVTLLAIPWVEGSTQPEALVRAYGATTYVMGEQSLANDAPRGYPPESAKEIMRARGRSPRQGAIVFFTGLSGSGKSTIASALYDLLRDDGTHGVMLLDGDAMRRSISAGLGFDRASRNENVKRLGIAAAKIAQTGGIAIVAPIAPFSEGREMARQAASGRPFLLVHISTPLEICETRDRKGLYARARTGEIEHFTGISSPYEVPLDADLTFDASKVSVYDAAAAVKDQLSQIIG